ncbi:MAG TPA: GntR family transcriptional regulator [Balneolales bacterium]|nr:GntR family transcriptional regulator [Balneolales bacterium]
MKSAEYIANRIRLLIATRQFQVDEVLPSTRELGKQLEVSFHTVRKAYHMLAGEGLLHSEPGRGFVVARQNTVIEKSKRLELGADRMRQLLEELIGYGLSEDEIEEIFEEQLEFMEWPGRLEKCATVGTNEEHAAMLAASIKKEIGISSDTMTIDQSERAVNYDALFVPIAYYQLFKAEVSEDILLIPIIYRFDSNLLLSIVERGRLEAISLVTQEEESIQVLVDELKLSLKFSGSFIAGAIYGKSLPLFVRTSELILYTPAGASLVEKQLPEKRRLLLQYEIAEQSADHIRQQLWDQ